MYTTYSQVPFYRKNWFAILTFFLVTPVFLLVLFTGPIYYEKSGELRTYGKGVRWAFALLVGLAVISAIVGSPKSLRATAQQPEEDPSPSLAASGTTLPAGQKAVSTPSPAQKVSTAQPTEQEAMEASRRDSEDTDAQQPATQLYGPAIKGLQLGNDYEATSKVLDNMGGNIGNGVSIYTPTNTDNPLVFPQLSGGRWLTIASAANSPVPSVVVHFDTNNNVDYYEIHDLASSILFAANNMSAEEFAQAIANNYNVSSLDPQPPTQGEINMAANLGGDAPAMHYVHEENNWRIDVHSKDVKVMAVQPQGQRFN